MFSKKQNELIRVLNRPPIERFLEVLLTVSEISKNDLALDAGASPGSAYNYIKSMQDVGLIECNIDGRYSMCRLTDYGLRIINTVKSM